MVKHTKVYLDSLGLTDTDFVQCEVCEFQGIMKRSSEIHHIIPRGMGGSKTKDYIENLMAVCRDCHNECEDRTYSREKQQKIHETFLKNRL